MTDTPRLVRRLDATALIEGDEFVRKYFHTERLVFAVSVLQPGQRSALDPGHDEADEVCYVIEGSVAVIFPDSDLVYELEQGDAILVPASAAHEVLGLGTGPVVMVWTTAPGLGRPDMSLGGGKQ
jgi:mannose-6-phosphate isomerase-like protein (cupin superfamily)